MASLGRVALATLLSCVGGVAQVVLNHSASYVLSTDVDVDGLADVLLFDGQSVHVQFGTSQSPYFRQGPSTAVPSTRRACEPVISGRYFWLASLGALPSQIGWLDAWRIEPTGALVQVVTYPLPVATTTGEIISLSIAPLAFDFGNDGNDDVVAVWSEVPRVPTSSVRAAWFSPLRQSMVVDFPPIPAVMQHHTIVGLHQTENVAQSPDEHLLVIAPPPFPNHRGIVFARIGRGLYAPTFAGEVTFTMAPLVRYRGFYDERARSVYGRFAPTPALASLAVHFMDGPTVAFDPLPGPPFVHASGSWLDTSISAALLTNAVADFDGDGADEIVLIDSLPGIGDVLVVTDPMPQSREFQAFWYPPGNWSVANHFWPFHVVHAAPADVNGDGLVDLVASVRETASTSRLSLFLGVRSTRSLRRAELVRMF